MRVITLQEWENIRTRHFANGESIKAISRATGFSKNTVRKYLRSDVPPIAATPPPQTARLTPYVAEIDALLRAEPKITARRVVAVLRDRHEMPVVAERSARAFIAQRRRVLVPREAFVRQVYTIGDQMQIDFADIVVNRGGASAKLHLFTARLSASGALFARAYRSEDRPTLLDGIVRSCLRLGGVPRECVFDNAKTAVTRVHRGRKRDVASEYAETFGALGMLFAFAAPAKGNEKGGVEGAHGYVRDNFFCPRRDGSDLAELNAALLAFCDERNASLGETVARELAALRPLPAPMPTPCTRDAVQVNKFAEVRVRTNRYSVPTRYAHRAAIVELFAERVRIIVDDEEIAVHDRSFERNDAVLDPLHYLDLLQHKHRAVERAEVFASVRFPEELRALLRAYVDENRETAGKRFTAVVALLRDYDLEILTRAVAAARQRGTNDPAAIELLLRQEAQIVPHVEPLVLPATTLGVCLPDVDLQQYATALIAERAA